MKQQIGILYEEKELTLEEIKKHRIELEEI